MFIHIFASHTLSSLQHTTMLAKKEPFRAVAEAAAVKVELGFSGLDLDMHGITNIKLNGKSKRRFSDAQIKSLEVMFESDSRPESVIKQQLANELGLQPRQIAIWFQNRRARSKAKQVERDYNVLKENYDALSSSYESLKRENQSLRIQLQKLKSQVETERGNRPCVSNSGNRKPENSSDIFDTDDNITILFDDRYNGLLSCDDDSRNAVSRGEDRVVLETLEATDGSLTSSENWCSLEPGCSPNWWEYW